MTYSFELPFRTTGEFVSVEMARRYLATMIENNRNPNPRTVRAYADMMIAGDWELIPQGLVFDRLGRLIDGQHRLLAVIEANMPEPIPFAVARDASVDAIDVIDSGLKRTAAQAAKISGLQGVSTKHLAVARVLKFDGKNMATLTAGNCNRDILSLYDRHRDAIEMAVARYPALKSKPVTLSLVRGPVARAFYSQDLDRLVQFLQVLDSGVPQLDLQADSAAIILRNHVRSIAGDAPNSGSEGTRGRADLFLIAQSALSAFLRKTKTERLPKPSAGLLFLLPEEMSASR